MGHQGRQTDRNTDTVRCHKECGQCKSIQQSHTILSKGPRQAVENAWGAGRQGENGIF